MRIDGKINGNRLVSGEHRICRYVLELAPSEDLAAVFEGTIQWHDAARHLKRGDLVTLVSHDGLHWLYDCPVRHVEAGAVWFARPAAKMDLDSDVMRENETAQVVSRGAQFAVVWRASGKEDNRRYNTVGEAWLEVARQAARAA